MTDPRYAKLADTLIGYSCAMQPGEKILIEAIDVPHAFTCGWSAAPPRRGRRRWSPSRARSSGGR